MTIQYNYRIGSASPLNFFWIVLRWKGSVWKATILELIAWSLAFQFVGLVYHFLLPSEAQSHFRRIAMNIDKRMSYIPLEFILGFFVNAVVKRWTDIVHNMGYLEDQAIFIANGIPGSDDETRMLRRTIVRYLCLTQVLVFRDICTKVRRRFPTYESIIKAGILLEEEKVKLESYNKFGEFTEDGDMGKYWVPISWAFGLIVRAREEGKIKADIWSAKLCDEIRRFQNSMQAVCNYDWVKVPLAYPQFVFLAVHIYFFICLIGKQFWKVRSHEISHVHFPIITMLQYMFYVGWMKVAGSLMYPFGEDDDDFETNFLIDKNLSTCLCIVDEACGDLPELEKDQFWMSDRVQPVYSLNSIKIPNHPLIGSAALKLNRPEEEPEMMVVKRNVGSGDQSPITTPVSDIRL